MAPFARPRLSPGWLCCSLASCRSARSARLLASCNFASTLASWASALQARPSASSNLARSSSSQKSRQSLPQATTVPHPPSSRAMPPHRCATRLQSKRAVAQRSPRDWGPQHLHLPAGQRMSVRASCSLEAWVQLQLERETLGPALAEVFPLRPPPDLRGVQGLGKET